MEQRKINGSQYWKDIKSLFTNIPFIIIFLFLGAAMGYVNTITTKLEQILCSRGYTDQLAGTCGALILFTGFLASFPMGLIVYKTKRPILVTKVSMVTCFIFIGLMPYVLQLPNQTPGIITTCILFGIFGLGCYPICLDLIIECTYPINEAIGTAFIFLSSALQGVILMVAENHLSENLSNEEMKIQVCVETTDDWTKGHQQPQNYSNYLTMMTVYIISISSLFLFFFKTELKRTNADKEKSKCDTLLHESNDKIV